MTLSWDAFTDVLARVLADLNDGQFLIIERRPGRGYVQFAGDVDALHAEAMSLQYIEADPDMRRDRALIESLHCEIGELGWFLPVSPPPEALPPGSPYLGSPNYHSDWDAPVPFDEVARLAVTTLRRAYLVRTPAHLRYSAFEDTARFRWLHFPSLGIRRRDR